MKKSVIYILAMLVLGCVSPESKKETKVLNLPKRENFEKVVDGKKIGLFLLQNKDSIKVYITNYGARIVSLIIPDKNGNFNDIVLGFDNIDDYLTKDNNMYLGPIVGRYANRIDEAKFTLDGETYELFKNNGNNTLHGGQKGFDKRIWDVEKSGNKIVLTYLSPDGEEGYPGNLKVVKTYTLTDDNELLIDYEAETDKATIVNLSHHSYMNLKGEGDTTVLDHYLMINADSFTPVDDEWIPTGEIASVEGTPFDFREGKKIGRDINADDQQLKNGLGYDHNWVLNKESEGQMTLACKLWEETTGRLLEVYTTEPGMQFYSGNFMDGTKIGKSGKPYLYRSAMIFETQHFPDSPNHDNFPSTVLRPGEKYTHSKIIKFKILEE